MSLAGDPAALRAELLGDGTAGSLAHFLASRGLLEELRAEGVDVEALTH